MDLATVIIVVVAGFLAILSGWLVPLIFKSRRPYGLLGDILVCLIPTIVLAWLEWVFILPAIAPGWLSPGATIAAAIGEPVILGWICLWILRKVKPAGA